MNTDIIQIIQLISPIATPVVILLLGLKINKTLEANKTTIAKDKEWRAEWAKRFYLAVVEFNTSVDDCIFTLVEFAPNSKSDVLKYSNQTYSLLAILLKAQNGSLEDTQKGLFNFNEAAMRGHREILGK